MGEKRVGKLHVFDRKKKGKKNYQKMKKKTTN